MANKTQKQEEPPIEPEEDLIEVVDGRLPGGRRFLFYGQEAVGKTTLAAHAPKPIFIDIENGSANMSVARYKFKDGIVPQTYSEILKAVKRLTTAKHDFQTLVIDSLDRVENLIHDHVLERDSGKQSNLNKYGKKLESIESYGYGKGYQVAYEEFCSLLRGLETLMLSRGMNIILIAHSKIGTFKNPEGEDYDRYWIRVHQHIAGKSKEWVDVCGFACYEAGGDKMNADDNRAKGWSTGRRLLKLQHSAAYDAKSRIPLPKEIELLAGNPWAPLQEAIESAEETPEEILEAIKLECQRLGDHALTEKVRAACQGVLDTAKLSRYLMDLRNRTPQEESTNV